MKLKLVVLNLPLSSFIINVTPLYFANPNIEYNMFTIH